jgi:hypothetical protein
MFAGNKENAEFVQQKVGNTKTAQMFPAKKKQAEAIKKYFTFRIFEEEKKLICEKREQITET